MNASEPYRNGDKLFVPEILIRYPAKLGLRAEEVLLVLQVYNLGVSPGDKLPSASLVELGQRMGLDKSNVFRWQVSLEKKGYLVTAPKKSPSGPSGRDRRVGTYWDFSPLWKAVEALSSASTH